MRPVLAEALSMLGTERAMVVCGDDGLDEVSLAEPTQVTAVEGTQLRQLTWTPEQFGLSRAPLTSMLIDGPAASAAIIRDVVSGKPGPARDIVVLNAAAALLTAAPDQPPQDCARRAAEAIDEGSVENLLARLVEVSNA
jgi:anthranilate phosphoribosyltransferase